MLGSVLEFVLGVCDRVCPSVWLVSVPSKLCFVTTGSQLAHGASKVFSLPGLHLPWNWGPQSEPHQAKNEVFNQPQEVPLPQKAPLPHNPTCRLTLHFTWPPPQNLADPDGALEAALCFLSPPGFQVTLMAVLLGTEEEKTRVL